jgi:signal transduction histidine kinase/integral membrane sensor domain MASE1
VFWRATWFHALVLGVAFFALARLAHGFVYPPQPGSVLWLPSGLSLAFLLRSRPRRWPALLAAVFLAEVASSQLRGLGVPLWASMSWGLGNCVRPLLGAWLMRRFVGSSIQLNRRWEIGGLVLLGAVVSPVPSATLGVLTGTYWTGAPVLLSGWLGWWLSDALGTVLVAPILLTLKPALLRPGHLRFLLELAVVLSLTVLSTTFLFGRSMPQGLLVSGAYAGFPLIIWAALRLGPLGAASTSAVLGTVALWLTITGSGPFAVLVPTPHDQVLTAQFFLAILSLSGLTLAATVCERLRSEANQRVLAEAGAMLASSLDIHTTFPRMACLIVPRLYDGFAVWLVGDKGLLERIAQAGWNSSREARLVGHVPPLPTHSKRWCNHEGTVVLTPLRVRGSVRGALVLMSDEQVHRAGRGELALAEDLAHRCGMAMENSRLFTEAHEAIEVRNEFIAIAAHELRTPLTVLTLRMRSLETMLQREQVALAKEKMQTTSRQLVRLNQLIERLLDVGRIHTGRLELQRQQLDVAELLEQVVESFAEEAMQAGSELRVRVEPGLTAWWDPGRIEQALFNLLANALKFGAPHPIEVQASRVGTRIRIKVRDHGIGIAPGALERIFGRFERAVPSSEYGGLGLGLFLTRRIAEAHGGMIHVESQPGDGATFVLDLPGGQHSMAQPEHPHTTSAS